MLMENWEKEIILNNIDKLASLTICSSELLSKFLANRILSETDVEELEGLGDNRIKQASQLYKIVSTRRNSFSSLLEFLEETNQSGAVAVLKGIKVKPDTLDELRNLKYDKNSVLGRGSLGTVVYKGKFEDRDIAVKRMHLNIFECDQTPIDHEIKILKACDEHENIVRYLGELCEMNLKEWVADKRIEISPIEVLRQSTVGLDWLHQNKIVHRDFKPENILLSQKMNLVRVKISDFGLSRHIIDGKNYVCTLSNFGPQGWVAPEILLQVLEDGPNRGKFTIESDVFALGCVYYYVLTDGKHAFGDFIRCQTNILDDKATLKHTEVKHGCAQNLQFVKLMISMEPTLRPTCSAILCYPIFWQEDRLVKFLENIFDNEFDCYNGQEVVFEGLNCLETCMFHNKLEINTSQRMGCVIPTAFIRMQENALTLMPYHYPPTELEQTDTNEALRINDTRPSVIYVPAEILHLIV
ncbi:Serine/threonine-protein kinase/endoribonuclease IRE1 [Orchesella cincta]|uniref:Serine/threonine-protein kinase/endoribonuclease IRE1 n=1 Tax=Orchesella cincta TaxID=48709 RepID=A0A1D2M499_ORCCI|nr:Serine/threonine-protein kinase/endoribonuclease IRE1 [Orchesella cincta]